MIYIKNEEEIEGIRKSGKLLAELFMKITEEGLISEGISTKEVDKFIEHFIREKGGYPAFLGYRGYPASACISINEEVVHGIPDEKRRFKKGDLVKIDTGINLNGFISDAARSYYVGDEPPEEVKRLMESVKVAFWEGVQKAVAGNRVSDISNAVWKVARRYRVSVIKELGGHGVGLRLHEDPFIPNYGPAGRGPVLKKGMVLAIEPMFAAGSGRVYTKKDGWTIATVDGSLTAHYENTVLVKEKEAEILTEL